MNTEPKTEYNGGSKFDLVPVAQKTQEFAAALWRKPSVRLGVIPGLVIAAVGMGVWAHWRQTKAADPQGQMPSSEFES